MYNETYEEYIRSILGYPNYTAGASRTNMYDNEYMESRQMDISSSQIEECYPEIYRIIYPMVVKACNSNFKPITPELIDRMTDDIYSSVETDNQINVNINLTNEMNRGENRAEEPKSNSPRKDFRKEENRSDSLKEDKIVKNRSGALLKDKKVENRGEDRQFRNRDLNDLIRILIIRELLERQRHGRPRSSSNATTEATNETTISGRTK